MVEEFDLGELIIEEELDLGEIEMNFMRVYPALENIEITPTAEEQNLVSELYGFKNVIVKPGVDSRGATAVSNEIISGKTAYVNNEEITGTIKKYDGAYTGSAILNSELEG